MSGEHEAFEVLTILTVVLTLGCCYTMSELYLTIPHVITKSIGQAHIIYLVHFRAQQPQEKGINHTFIPHHLERNK